jgi:hypothetical protein
MEPNDGRWNWGKKMNQQKDKIIKQVVTKRMMIKLNKKNK